MRVRLDYTAAFLATAFGLAFIVGMLLSAPPAKKRSAAAERRVGSRQPLAKVDLGTDAGVPALAVRRTPTPTPTTRPRPAHKPAPAPHVIAVTPRIAAPRPAPRRTIASAAPRPVSTPAPTYRAPAPTYQAPAPVRTSAPVKTPQPSASFDDHGSSDSGDFDLNGGN